MEMTECGAASLAMVVSSYGCHIPLYELRGACGVDRNGAKAIKILAAARHYGFDANAYSLAMGDLDDMPMPMILHWGFEHFVVLERINSGHGWIIDPAVGRRKMTRSAIGEMFTGVALQVQPKEDTPMRPREPIGFEKYREEFRAMVPVGAMVCAIALMLQVIVIAAPMALQLLIDKIVPQGRTEWMIGLGVAVGLAFLAEQSLSVVRERTLYSFHAWMNKRMMGRFVEHVVSLPIRFFQQRQAGDLANRMWLLEDVHEFVMGQVVSAVLSIATMMAVFACLFVYSPMLGLITILSGVARMALTIGFGATRKDMIVASAAAGGREVAILSDAFYGLETLKAAKSEDMVLERWFGKMTARIEMTLRQQRLESVVGILSGAISAVAMAATLWFGGKAVLAGRMTLGEVTAFLSLQAISIAPMDAIISILSKWREFVGNLERLEDVWQEQPVTDGKVEANEVHGRITMKDVTFSYSKDAGPAIDGISIDIRPSERIALVGGSGSGKTTMASLLIGMLIPDAGQIAYDGIDLRDFRLESVLAHIGVVPQNAFLFDDTIIANIAFGYHDATPERIREAATMACLDGDLERFPEGIYTKVGDGGCRLSGGQRQRVCIARALVRKPAILLMDEATSALDLDTERKIHEHLRDMGCTRIVIAHRVTTVMDADRVIVMQAGRIVQVGTPAELANVPGYLADMLASQEGAA
jgi:ABC-type bacteriocin/lantibiotic exporter with double-glycine peptidase domain